MLRGLLGTGQGGSGWLRAKCSCTADTVEYLEHCCKTNQGGEMDSHPQESFLKQNRRVNKADVSPTRFLQAATQVFF